MYINWRNWNLLMWEEAQDQVVELDEDPKPPQFYALTNSTDKVGINDALGILGFDGQGSGCFVANTVLGALPTAR